MSTNFTLDYVKTKIKDAAPSSFQFYNLNVPEHVSTEKSYTYENLGKNNDIIIQNCNNGNSVVLLDKDVSLRCMENILGNQTKSEVNFKGGILIFGSVIRKALTKF